MAQQVVVDASAVLAWVLREKQANLIAQILPYAIIPAANLVGVVYRAAQEGHSMTAAELCNSLYAMGLTVEPAAGLMWSVRANSLRIPGSTPWTPTTGASVSMTVSAQPLPKG